MSITRLRAERLSGGLFALAAAGGLIVALGSALRVDAMRLPAGLGEAIAVVDGVAIPRARYEQAIAALEADKRTPLTDADRARALERLIDEELLLARALALDLPHSEPAARKALIEAMLRFATAEAETATPSEAELSRFYAARPQLLAPALRVRARAAALDPADRARIDALAGRLRAGEPLLDAAEAVGAALLPAPEGLAAPSTLETYLGPTAAATALRLRPGESAGPIEAGGIVLFVETTMREEGPRPELDQVREALIGAWRRQRADAALDAYLAELRAEAEIARSDDARQ